MKNSKSLAAVAARNQKITKGCKFTKKTIAVMTTVAVMCCVCCTTAFASSGVVDTTDFISKASTVLKSVICLIGAGVGVWGVANLLEGYGNDNPGAKSQGMKQLMAGLGLILLGIVMVPVLEKMMTDAV